MFDPSDPRNLLYERPHYFKVFISSKMRQGSLAAERRIAIETVDGFRPARAWAWERDAVAGSFYSEEECVRQAGTSDALILILEEELTRVTEAEYRAARASGANTIVLHRRGVSHSTQAAQLIERAREEGISKEFSDLVELESEIDSALWQWFVRGGRTLALQVRERRERLPDRSLLDRAELGDSDDGEFETLAEAVEGTRDLVRAGRAPEALADLYAWASVAADEGHFPLAHLLLEELREIVPAEEIDEMMRGWILNVQGRIVSGEGKANEAVACFEQMRQIGVAIGNHDLLATAHQNLGVQDVIAGDAVAAGEHFRESYRLKTEIGEYYGAIQITLNMCNVLMDRDELAAARELLDDLDPHLKGRESYPLRATLHGQRGLILVREGRLADAKQEFQCSLREARKAHSGTRQLTPLQNLGSNALERGQPTEAKRWYRKALAIADGLGDEQKVRLLHGALGNAFAVAEEWEAAGEEFANSARLAARLGELGPEAEAWANVAACWLNLNRPERAHELIKQALANPHAGKAPDWRAGQLRNLGEILELLEDSAGAIERLAEAARLAEDVELKDSCLQRAAEITLAHPDLAERAVSFFDETLALQRQAGASADWAWRAAQIGAQLSESSQVASAPRFFSLALRVFARNGDCRRAFYVRNDRAIAWSRLGNLAAAVRDVRAALQIAKKLGDMRLQFQGEMNLGELERRRGRLAAAEAHLLRAHELAERLGDDLDLAATLNLIGLLRVGEGQLEDAEEAYGRALAIARRLRDHAAEHGALGGLGGIAFRRSRYAEAERRYSQAVRKHGEIATVALAEDLSGLALSRAARGHVVEAEVQRLLDISDIVGWDRHCAEELTSCASLLAETGDEIDEAISLQAAALICALRGSGLIAESENSRMAALADAVVDGFIWMGKRNDYGTLKDRLLNELKEAFGVEGTGLDFLGTLFEEAEKASLGSDRR